MTESNSTFNGFYRNVDSDTDAIPQLLFAGSGCDRTVKVWQHCHPEDCEWVETRLYLLEWSPNPELKGHAFASWNSGFQWDHCYFVPTPTGIKCMWFLLPGSKNSNGLALEHYFEPGQSQRILEADPLHEYRKMWDGSEPGWKLVQFSQPVYVIEFHFDQTGPTRQEFETLKEFSSNHTDGDENTWRESLLDISGHGIAKPILADRLKLLHSHQLQNHLDLTIRTITTDDYLYLSPEGNYATWLVHPDDHQSVVNKMLESKIEIEHRTTP